MESNIVMDVYEIIKTHNKAGSAQEIICFIIIFILALAVSCFLLRFHRIVLSQAGAGVMLLVFLAVVFNSTVFSRKSTGVCRYELELFWSWREVLDGNKVSLQENLLNCILLFPAGVFLSVMFRGKLRWWKGLLSGVVISAVIEVCQLVLHRGLFEWDDIIHNGIGCMLGCLLANKIIKNWL